MSLLGIKNINAMSYLLHDFIPSNHFNPYPLAFHYALLLIDSHSYILFFLFFEKYQ